jgi:hypothetical protein
VTDLKPFQAATVETVLAAFRRRRRVRRFLVADEVGLGKTVVAQHVIRSMMRGLGRPLIVFYMCSNLAIARQNRRKLLEVLPSEEQDSADCPVDRLSLLPASERPSHKRLNLYSLTPDTSIPIRKQHRRDGRQEERALVHVLIERVWPALFDEFGKDVFQRNASVHWHSSIHQHRDIASNVALREAFARSVRTEFGLEAGQHLVAQLRTLNDAGSLDELELIAHLRNALAASAIEEISPDLVIFDEFQRFQDLLDPPADLDPAAKRVIGRLRGDDLQNPPALLLLSATPYRLFTRRWEEETGASHRNEFFDLIEFLYGSDSDAKRKRGECENAFVFLENELRKGRPMSPEAADARQAVEALLCPIIARTERASHENGWDHFLTESLPAPITREDITVFKHLSGSFTDDQRSSAVPYWTSIPLPMQTMGNQYVAWKLSRRVPADGVPHLSEAMRDRFERPRLWPHPRLRAIQELMPLKQMALPWLAPTSSWWSLRGAWQDRGVLPRKLLVFSRFRAVPQAVAAALSFDLEAQFLADEKLAYGEVSKRRLLSATDKRHALLGLFHPSPFLVTATDPLAAGSEDLQVIRRAVRQQLKQALKDLALRITDKARTLPVWRALARIESRAGNWDWVSRAWWEIHSDIATGEDEDSGLAQLLGDWDVEAEEECDAITPAVFESLVDYAVGSPGVVVGRALLRHWPEAVSEDGFVATLDAAWNGLRNYLDQRWFYRVLRKGNENYPDALSRVVVDGNLEAVLDEHLWITSRLRSLRGKALANELKDGMTIKSGLFYLHPVEGNKANTFSIRCHVAMPFVQSRVAYLEGGEKPIRSDELRRAFNTPFWPYVLATTSVGQEGLDFHSWCDTLVHWDLCRNPVDLEQREGRIQRFGGLSVRRAIAKQVGTKAMASRAQGESPWARIAGLADGEMSDASGLAPWWVCPGGNVSRYVFSVPTSEERHWLHWVREQRLLYRLALGQPNQEDLLEILSSKAGMDPGSVRQAVINLSPWFRKSNGNGTA